MTDRPAFGPGVYYEDAGSEAPDPQAAVESTRENKTNEKASNAAPVFIVDMGH